MTYMAPVLPLLLALLLAGFLLQRFAAWRRVMVASGIAIFLWMWPPVCLLLSATLESRYPERVFPGAEAQAIVILSGATSVASPEPERLPGMTTYARCRYGVWLYRNWRRLPVVVTGGPPTGTAPADIMRGLVEEGGVPASDVTVERDSRSTQENAAFTARILHPRGIRTIALVTDAFHMRRAELAFRKQGFNVIPAACGYRKRSFERWLALLVPNARVATYNDDVVHEWVGLAWYRITGAI
jgi:uncharacterized SAM-binding protein YcdF (DUF218 family)